ncbi:MAG: hypothetical protein IPO77_00610 [Acidobacteria bacterium]|nr:hypothetical protein [Acidobacteriota bacterium]
MATNPTQTDPDALVSLIERVKENYQEPPPSPPKRGRKRDFSALSFLLLALVAVTMRTFRDSELRKLLEKDPRLREAMGFERVPHQTSIGRRLSSLVSEAEQLIALLGECILAEVKPQTEQPEASAIDGRMYQAQGPKWHQGDRKKDLIPNGLRNVDTESKWSKSGYRGWIQGYRLLLQGLVFPAPVPIFAAWRPNNEYEANIAIESLLAYQLKVTDVLLGDETFGGGLFPYLYEEAGGWVLTSKQLPEEKRSWKNDLFDYRKQTIELLFQRIIQSAELKECTVKGEGRNGSFVLAHVWVYQVCFLADYRAGKPIACIKDHLDCARWRVPSG